VHHDRGQGIVCGARIRSQEYLAKGWLLLRCKREKTNTIQLGFRGIQVSEDLQPASDTTKRSCPAHKLKRKSRDKLWSSYVLREEHNFTWVLQKGWAWISDFKLNPLRNAQ